MSALGRLPTSGHTESKWFQYELDGRSKGLMVLTSAPPHRVGVSVWGIGMLFQDG